MYNLSFLINTLEKFLKPLLRKPTRRSQETEISYGKMWKLLEKKMHDYSYKSNRGFKQ